MTICSTKGEKKRKLSSISAGWGDASRRGRNDRRNAEHCAVNEHAFRCGAGRTPPSGSGPGGMDPACGRRTGRNARGPSSTRKPACGKRRQCLLQGRGFRSFPKVLRRASLAEISAAPFLRPAAPAGKRLERLPPLDRVARCRSPRIPPLAGRESQERPAASGAWSPFPSREKHHGPGTCPPFAGGASGDAGCGTLMASALPW